MFRLPEVPLSTNRSDLLVSLLHDLAALGFVAQRSGGRVAVSITKPVTLDEREKFWDDAHQRRHLAVITQRASTILELREAHSQPPV